MTNTEQNHTPGPLNLTHEPCTILSAPNGFEVMTDTHDGLIFMREDGTDEQYEATLRLVAASYNAFDSASARLGVNAVELAERMQDGGIAELVEALKGLTLTALDTTRPGYPQAHHRSLGDAVEQSRAALVKAGAV